MKRKLILVTICVLLVCLLIPLFAACDDPASNGGKADKLVVYNWEDYIDPDILSDFEQYYLEQTGRRLEVVYTTFDTNETMMTKVLKDDANVDLIAPSEYAIEKLMLAEKLMNISEIREDLSDTLEGYGIAPDGMHDNIEPKVMEVIKEMFDGIEGNGKTYNMSEYMVPYMWGTLGILYNKKYVSEEELDTYGWGVLWNEGNNEKIENKILMKDSIRDSYAAAVMYMKEYDLLPQGYNDYTVPELINCTDQAMLDAAEKVLTEQRDHISGYEVDFGKDDMLNEIVYVDLAWSGDALWAIEESYDEETEDYMLGYYVPKVGSNIWYDAWVIPKTVKNKLAAVMFIDYMCRPMSGIRNSMYIGYTSAVAKELMQNDEEVREFIFDNYYDPEAEEEYNVDIDYFGDTGRYPDLDDPKLMANLGVMRDFGPANENLVNMWEVAKAGKSLDPALIYTLIAIAAIAAIIIGGYFIKEALKLRSRRIPQE